MLIFRGLRFIQVLLQSLVDGEKDENNPNLIRVNANRAYEVALKRYHGWLIQKLFKVKMSQRSWVVLYVLRQKCTNVPKCIFFC